MDNHDIFNPIIYQNCLLFSLHVFIEHRNIHLYFIILLCTFLLWQKNKTFEEPDKMEEWLKITLCVSLFATFRDFRPVDSFYTSYLTSPAVNFTAEQVSFNITYALLFLQ